METAAESVSAEAELRALSRKIRNVSRQCKRRAPQAGLRDLSGELEQLGTRRCATDSLMSMLIYILAGHSSCAAADFVCGRGWRRSLPPPKQQDDLAAEVEWTYIGMPTSVLVDLEMDPLELVCKKDLLVAARYVVEHRLAAWVEVQNVEHGVAPSRAQMVQYAVASVPSAAPLEVQNHVRSLLQGTARKERKYLANFRSRRNAKYGSLRVEDAVDVAERRQKVGFTGSSAL